MGNNHPQSSQRQKNSSTSSSHHVISSNSKKSQITDIRLCDNEDMLELTIKYNKLINEKNEQMAAHEGIVRSMEASIAEAKYRSGFDKKFYLVVGIVIGFIAGFILRGYFMEELKTVEACEIPVRESIHQAPMYQPEKTIEYSNPVSNDFHRAPVLFSLSNTMYMIGAIVILASYTFQMYKTLRTVLLGSLISLVYCGIFIIAAENLYPLANSQLVGGCYYVVACFLMGAAGLSALEYTERHRFQGPFRHQAHISSFFDIGLAPDIALAADAEALFDLLPPFVKLGGVFALFGGLAIILYRRSHFPGLLFPVFLGAYGSFVLISLCIHCAFPNAMIRFPWITFVFGVLCVGILLHQDMAKMVDEDSVLRLSLIISSLNCCVPTLPMLLAQQMELVHFDQWSPFLRDMNRMRLASSKNLYRAGVCVLYGLLNCVLLGASRSLGTWLHVPYIILAMTFLVANLLGNMVFVVTIGLPFVLTCLALPSILTSVRDETVYSVSISIQSESENFLMCLYGRSFTGWEIRSF